MSQTPIDLSTYLIEAEVVRLVPEALARKRTVMPVSKNGRRLTVAMADPMNLFAIDELRLKTQCEITTVVASERSIRDAIEQHYGTRGTMEEVSQAIAEAQGPAREEAAEEAPIIRLVDLIILHAMKERASDIHIEPGDGVLRTRFRTDGILREVNGPPLALHGAVVSRVKVLAKLDIAEKRRPQDGRFRVTVEGKPVDLRVSTLPTQFGEKVVLRLLDPAQMLLSLGQLGLDEPMRQHLEALIRRPHGILLATGPTGSGKTTTLYAALSLLNSEERNILTIEDPIEYHLAGINQVQVSPKTDVTFASALRAFLRQDPDVMMVGEIRDRETAEIAIQAALTGHVVLSTLHTNDAASSLTRLTEMDVEPFLIASAVVGALAQRLVRVLCPGCKAAYRPEGKLAGELGLEPEVELFRGAGCEACGSTGYKGRIGLFELLPMAEPVKDLVVSRAPAHALREAARKLGMRSLREDGLAKARAGLTSLEEVLRVTQLE